MGAIDILTNTHVYPKMAEKGKNYKCPDCNNPCIFKKGNIKAYHFAHKAQSNCSFYDKPSEGQIHKEAKRQLCVILNQKKLIHFRRFCERGYHEKIPHDARIIKIKKYYSETTIAKEEFSFPYNDSIYRADIALIDNNQIKFIIEICDKHKTLEERRPEPWVEIDAEDLLENINNPDSEFGDINDPNSILKITCIRHRLCDLCILSDEYEKEEQKRKDEALKKKIIEDAINAKRKKEERERLERLEKEKLEVLMNSEEWLIWEEKIKKDKLEKEKSALETLKKNQEEKEHLEQERIELLKKQKKEKAQNILEKKRKNDEIKKLLEKKKKEEETIQYENALKAAKIRVLSDEEKKCLEKVNKLKLKDSLLNWLSPKKEENNIENVEKLENAENPTYACDFCEELFKNMDNCLMHEINCPKKPKPKIANNTFEYAKYTHNYNSCQRCGSTGHYTKYCKSTWHIDGYELSDNEDSD